MTGIDRAEGFGRAGPSILGRRLVGMEPVHVHGGDVRVRLPVHDPVGDDASDPAPGQDADRVETRGDEEVPQLGSLADDRLEIGCEALRTAEELPDPGLGRDRDPPHRGLDVGRHPIEIGRDLTEGEVGRNAVHAPGCGHRLEEADHEAPDLFAVVGVGCRILDHGPLRRQVGDLLGDQVVVLGGLERDGDAGQLAELAGPHPGAVDDELRLDLTGVGADPRDGSVTGGEAGHRDVLDDRHASHAGALCQRHGDVDGVGSSVAGHVEPGEDVVGAGCREELADFACRDLVDVDAEVPVERCDPAVFLEAVAVGGDLDEPDGSEAGVQSGLGREPLVEVAGVHPQLGGCR